MGKQLKKLILRVFAGPFSQIIFYICISSSFSKASPIMKWHVVEFYFFFFFPEGGGQEKIILIY